MSCTTRISPDAPEEKWGRNAGHGQGAASILIGIAGNECFKTGQPVQISVDAYPEHAFSGEIAYIYPTVSPETRAAQVRVEMSNKDIGLLDRSAATVIVNPGQ